MYNYELQDRIIKFQPTKSEENCNYQFYIGNGFAAYKTCVQQLLLNGLCGKKKENNMYLRVMCNAHD